MVEFNFHQLTLLNAPSEAGTVSLCHAHFRQQRCSLQAVQRLHLLCMHKHVHEKTLKRQVSNGTKINSVSAIVSEELTFKTGIGLSNLSYHSSVKQVKIICVMKQRMVVHTFTQMKHGYMMLTLEHLKLTRSYLSQLDITSALLNLVQTAS